MSRIDHVYDWPNSAIQPFQAPYVPDVGNCPAPIFNGAAECPVDSLSANPLGHGDGGSPPHGNGLTQPADAIPRPPQHQEQSHVSFVLGHKEQRGLDPCGYARGPAWGEPQERFATPTGMTQQASAQAYEPDPKQLLYIRGIASAVLEEHKRKWAREGANMVFNDVGRGAPAQQPHPLFAAPSTERWHAAGSQWPMVRDGLASLPMTAVQGPQAASVVLASLTHSVAPAIVPSTQHPALENGQCPTQTDLQKQQMAESRQLFANSMAELRQLHAQQMAELDRAHRQQREELLALYRRQIQDLQAMGTKEFSQ